MWDGKTGVYKMAGTDADDNSDNPIKTFSIPRWELCGGTNFLDSERVGWAAQTQPRVQSGRDKNITSSVWWQEEALPCSLLAPHTDESRSPKE